MDVNLISTNVVQSKNILKTADLNKTAEVAKADETTTKYDLTLVNGVQDVAQLSSADVKNITQELNKFLQLLNADLQFEMHEETKQIMVKVVDTKTQKVLKEFPPHEFLDTIAKIRDYVGLLLDKKV